MPPPPPKKTKKRQEFYTGEVSKNLSTIGSLELKFSDINNTPMLFKGLNRTLNLILPNSQIFVS